MNTQIIIWVFISVAVFGAFWAIPITDDYKNYMGGTRLWLSGETRLYDGPETEFYYLPWSLCITALLSWLPDRIGQAILNLASFWAILVSLRVLVRKIPWWGIFMVLANLFTINLFFTAQWDALILAAVTAAWWAVQTKKPLVLGLAFLLMATKPTNIILPAIMILVAFLKERRTRDLLVPLGVILFGVAWSFWACGFDWPVRYLAYIREYSPPSLYNISIWRLGDWFGIDPVVLYLFSGLVGIWLGWVFIRLRINAVTLSMALVANLVLSPYVVSYHYIIAAPMFVWIARKKVVWAVGIYGIMILLFLHVADLIQIPPIYFIYPLSILVAGVVLTIFYPKLAKESP